VIVALALALVVACGGGDDQDGDDDAGGGGAGATSPPRATEPSTPEPTLADYAAAIVVSIDPGSSALYSEAGAACAADALVALVGLERLRAFGTPDEFAAAVDEGAAAGLSNAESLAVTEALFDCEPNVELSIVGAILGDVSGVPDAELVCVGQALRPVFVGGAASQLTSEDPAALAPDRESSEAAAQAAVACGEAVVESFRASVLEGVALGESLAGAELTEAERVCVVGVFQKDQVVAVLALTLEGRDASDVLRTVVEAAEAGLACVRELRFGPIIEPGPGASETLRAIAERGVIVVGIDSGPVGPSFVASEGGFEPALAEELARRLLGGVEIVVVASRFGLPDVISGQVDLLVDTVTARTPNGEALAAPTSSWYLDGAVATVLADAGLAGVGDLDGARVAVFGSLRDELDAALAAAGVTVDVVEVDTPDEALAALETGEADAAVTWLVNVIGVERPGTVTFAIDLFRPSPLWALEDDFAAEVDAVLLEVIADGTYERLWVESFGEPPLWTGAELLAAVPAE